MFQVRQQFHPKTNLAICIYLFGNLIWPKPQNPITLVLSMFERVRIDCQEMEMRNKVSLH